MDDEPIPTVPKPDALLALHDVTAELFDTLRRWFAVPGEVGLNLREIDSAVHELGDPLMIAALAMRKLQALHLLSTPGVITTTDVVVTIVQDLDRALVQAPNMHLKLQAAAADWDAELADLGTDPEAGSGAGSANAGIPDAELLPDEPTAGDPVIDLDLVAGIGGIGGVQGLPPEPDDEGPETDDSQGLLDGFEVSLAGLEQSLDGLADELDHELSLLHAGDLEALGYDLDDDDDEITDASQVDPAVERFRELHGRLHEAVYAVIEVSEGEIRYLA